MKKNGVLLHNFFFGEAQNDEVKSVAKWFN